MKAIFTRLTFKIENWAWYQRVLVTSLAGVFSYGIASRISNADAVIAAIMAIISLRVSIQASVAESFVQLLATAMGATLALVGLQFVSSTLAIIAIVIIFSFSAARVFDLGDDGAINITITGLIVAVQGSHTSTAIERLNGTLIGITTALVLSYWAHPQSPLDRTVKRTSALGLETVGLLREISVMITISKGSNFSALLTQARKLSDKTLGVRMESEEALRYAKWSPTIRRQDALSAYYKFIALEHIIVQVRNLSRGIYDLRESKIKLPKKTVDNLKNDIERVAILVSKKSEKLPRKLDFEFDQSQLDQAQRELEKSIDLFSSESDKKTLILLIGMYQALFRMIESLSSENPAIYAVTTPKISRNPMKNFIFSYRKFLRKK